MGNYLKFIVPEGVKEIRLLEFVLKWINIFPSRNGAKKAIKSGSLLLDGNIVETGCYVNSGQIITYQEMAKPVSRVFELPLEVLFEDEYLAVIIKPPGYSVSGNYFRTIDNALPYNLEPSSTNDSLPTPQTVHRLDNQTRGLLLIAKTHHARIDLGRQFEEKKIVKKYQAIVVGKVMENGIINSPIEGKEAITHFSRLQTVNSTKYGFLSLVELTPFTGRTHQLRIHLAGIGHPILGDKLYTSQLSLLKHKGLFLCATYLEFEHPITHQDSSFSLELPNKFKNILQKAIL